MMNRRNEIDFLSTYPLLLSSGGNQSYAAATIHSDTGSALISGGAIHFQTATKADTYLRASSKHNVAYQGKDHRQRVDTEEVQSRITSPLMRDGRLRSAG